MNINYKVNQVDKDCFNVLKCNDVGDWIIIGQYENYNDADFAIVNDVKQIIKSRVTISVERMGCIDSMMVSDYFDNDLL